LPLTYFFAAFELAAYQTTAMWVTITILHSLQYIGYVATCFSCTHRVNTVKM